MMVTRHSMRVVRGGPETNSTSSTYRQRGAMAIAMMLMLIGLVGMLGLIEVGYLYWAKRDTQKVADLASLAGAQLLTACTTGNTNNTAAYGNAVTENGFGGALKITCGNWDPIVYAGTVDHFAPAAAGVAPNAVKVVAVRPVTFSGWTFAGALPGVGAEAVSTTQPPIASFSVGSTLLGISPTSPLGGVLSSTLGTSLGLTLLSYSGIADANVSLLGLVNALPISAGTVNGVLSTDITVSEFLSAYVSALEASPGAADINISFVEAQVASIEAVIGDVPLSLGQILDVDANTTDPNIALNTTVSALDILGAALEAANGNHAVALDALDISVPGVASVNVAMTIVEPPQIGIGGVGTTAHTAQIRLDLNVSAVSTALTGGESLLSIPLYLEVAPTDATITAIACNVPGTGGAVSNDVTIGVAPGVLNAFLGELTPAAFSDTTVTWPTLIASGTQAPLVNVDLLGIPVAVLNASANVEVATTPAEALTFNVNPAVPMPVGGMTESATASPPVVLGTVLTSLLTSTSLKTSGTLLGAVPLGFLGPLLSGLTGLLEPVLSPLFNTLDTALVGPLLEVAGVSIGTADVNLISVSCPTSAQLVY